MSDPNELPPLFLMQCRQAIKMMLEEGISEMRIAVILQDIRSATLNEEYRRIKNLVEDNPPHHHRCGEILDAVKEQFREEGK